MSSSTVQEARLALGRRLREIRLTAGLTGRAIAKAEGWHCSKIPKIEAGKQVPSATDIRAWCALCGAQDQAADLISALHAADSMYQEWRRVERAGLKATNEKRARLAEQTRLFRTYESWVVPGLLQTRGYASAVLNMVVSLRGGRDVDAAVDVRMKRQQLLRRVGRRFVFLIEESVLHGHIGGVDTMAGQFDHLIAATRLPAVTLGIIPQGRERSLWPTESFYMYDNDQVSSELISAFLTVTQASEIREYARTFTLLADMAVYGDEARSLVTRARNSL